MLQNFVANPSYLLFLLQNEPECYYTPQIGSPPFGILLNQWSSATSAFFTSGWRMGGALLDISLVCSELSWSGESTVLVLNIVELEVVLTSALGDESCVALILTACISSESGVCS